MSTTDRPQLKKKKKTGRGLLVFLLILALIAGAYFVNQERLRRANEEALAQLETVPYTRETLTSTISGAGTIRPRQSATLYWQTSGFIGEVNFEVGEEVAANTVLYRLDDSRLPAEMLQAQLNLLNAQTGLQNLDSDTDLQRVTLQNNLTNAENTLTTLEQNLLALTDRECTDWRLTNLQTAYDDALENYRTWSTQARWLEVQAARADLDYCDPEVIASETDSLNNQINLQKQNIATWQAELEKIADGPDPDTKEKLELQLKLAEKQLESLAIKAPFDGTITSLTNRPGDMVSAGSPAAQIADLSFLFVDVPISEVDIPQIKVGQEAELVFDAYFDQTFYGTVTEVAIIGMNTAGIVNYNVTIQLDSDHQGIRPGMTVGVNILIEEKPNTYTVPAESIVSRNGNYFVYVLRDGKPVEVEVKIGAYSSHKIEVLQADIQDGEAILLSPPISLMDSFMQMGR
jgi:RND family efflux transporter MFP subunit